MTKDEDLWFLTNAELTAELAERAQKGIGYDAVSVVILFRVNSGQPTDEDRHLIREVAAKAEEIDEADLDLSHQSRRLRRLGGEFHRLESLLLARMTAAEAAAVA